MRITTLLSTVALIATLVSAQAPPAAAAAAADTPAAVEQEIAPTNYPSDTELEERIQLFAAIGAHVKDKKQKLELAVQDTPPQDAESANIDINAKVLEEYQAQGQEETASDADDAEVADSPKDLARKNKKDQLLQHLNRQRHFRQNQQRLQEEQGSDGEVEALNNGGKHHHHHHHHKRPHRPHHHKHKHNGGGDDCTVRITMTVVPACRPTPSACPVPGL